MYEMIVMLLSLIYPCVYIYTFIYPLCYGALSFEDRISMDVLTQLFLVCFEVFEKVIFVGCDVEWDQPFVFSPDLLAKKSPILRFITTSVSIPQQP